jgi:predicted methyltransferase
MKRQIKKTLSPMLLTIAASCAFAAAHAAGPAEASKANDTQQKLVRAINDEGRPAADTARDANRLPLETLTFFGLRDDMKVLDILPASYYTRILAPVLKERGELYLALGTGGLADSLLKEPGYKHVKTLSEKTTLHRPEGARYYDMNALDLPVQNLDMVTNFRVYHLFDDADRQALNEAVHGVLKPGGIYAVIDHTRRHAEPETEANRRRFDPVKAIKEIEAAGFDFVDYSPMHYRAADDLTLEVGDKSVTGQTDRWALKFVKR